MKRPFRERIKEKLIISDGAMGTLLEYYGYDDLPHAIQNIKHPEIVEKIHAEYIAAGSEIITTNTFSCNRLRLAQFHLDDRIEELNRSGVEIARRAAGGNVYVAGSVGPTGLMLEPIGKITRKHSREAFREQIGLLLKYGIDIVALESFVNLDELDEAISAAKELTDLPVIAQKAFSEDGSILSSSFPAEVINHLVEKGADIVGANCAIGPQRMLALIRNLHTKGVILSAQPSAGIPTMFEGKTVYQATPKYLASHACELVRSGVTLIGACCGSTPAHIKAISEAVDGLMVGDVSPVIRQKDEYREELEPEYYRTGSRWSRFAQHIGKKFVTAVELDIPRGLDMNSVLEGAQFCYERKIDAVNITDGARARLRMTPVAISVLVHQRAGIETITHFTARDRNLIGLQAELLGAATMGIRNILCVTGDPASIGDYPQATSVFDVDSIGLIRAAKSMNSGTDIAGNSIGIPTSFLVAAAANPAANNLDQEIVKCEKKAEAGADLFFTQPLFEMKTLAAFLIRIAHLKIPVVLGIIPLRNYRHADFLHHEVPGMKIPEGIREQIRLAGDNAGKTGIEIAKHFLKEAKSAVAGVYMMPPFRKYQVIDELMSVL